MPLLLADFIYSRDCKLNLRKNVDTTKELLVLPPPAKRDSNCHTEFIERLTINIPPQSGGYFSFGQSPNITGNAQVRF